MANRSNGRRWKKADGKGEARAVTSDKQAQAVALQGFEVPEGAQLTAQQAALLAAWVTTGNISKAAQLVGMNASYARRLFSQNANIALVAAAIEEHMQGVARTAVAEAVEEWAELVPRAKAVMMDLLGANDEKVRLWAAQDIVNRAEGKPVAKVEHKHTSEGPQLTEAQMRLAFSLCQAHGLSMAEALEYMRQHPQDVRQWEEQHAQVVSSEPLMLPGNSTSSAGAVDREPDSEQAECE